MVGERKHGPHVVYILTSAISTRLLSGQLSYLREFGFEVTLITSPDPSLGEFARREAIRAIPLAMSREISPWSDTLALWRLARLLRSLRPDLVNAGTPKAGLLGMLAASAAGVPVRIYTLRGLRLETCRGWRRTVLWWAEKLTATLAHRIVCVSSSLRETYSGLRLASPDKSVVLGAGSSNGVDTGRFQALDRSSPAIQRLRQQLAIPPAAPVIGFVGRLTRDKGIGQLHQALGQLRQRCPEARLLLVGDFEPGDPLAADQVVRLRRDPGVVITGMVDRPENYYPLMDVLALPSFREGFPNVALEASAAGLPIVAFDATGTRDAVVDGISGTLVSSGDITAFAAAIDRYLKDSRLRREHGGQGRRRVQEEFRQAVVWRRLAGLYLELLGMDQARDQELGEPPACDGSPKPPVYDGSPKPPPEDSSPKPSSLDKAA